MYKIIENFLNPESFSILEDYMMPYGHTTRQQFSSQSNYGDDNVPWSFCLGVSVKESESKEIADEIWDIEKLETINDKLFRHVFLKGGYQSNDIQSLDRLLATIDPLAICRIVANFTLPQKENRRSLFHIDYDSSVTSNSRSMTTSIFYMNSTNGPTLLEDGTKIECRANRLVTFPNETRHAAVLCTDQPYRVVINLNYFE